MVYAHCMLIMVAVMVNLIVSVSINVETLVSSFLFFAASEVGVWMEYVNYVYRVRL